MDSKYSCGICGTKPDQLSHHKSHLKTQKHSDNCANFIIDMKIFSLLFRQVHPKKWHESEYKDYIIAKYLEDTKEDSIDNENISKWIQKEAMTYGNGRYDWGGNCFDGVAVDVCYENETGRKVERTVDLTNIEYNNWGINKIVKYKETIQSKPERRMIGRFAGRDGNSNSNRYKCMLSRYTNIKFNKISDIRNGAVDLRYLSKPKHLLKFDNCDMEIYNDEVVRYSCLLFDTFGIQSLYPLYNGVCGPIDIEEHPEERKHNSFYFYKEVDVEYSTKIANVSNYGETRIEKRKIWTNCYMGDFIDWLDYLDNKDKQNGLENIPAVQYLHMSVDDVKYFIKESLIEIFSNKIASITRYIEDDPFCFSWKKSSEKIVYDRISKIFYIIGNGEMLCWRNEKVYVENMVSDEQREISADQKLTEEQYKEYKERREHIENLKEEIKYHEAEIVKLKELSLSSDTMNAIMNICQYLFEYNEDLIEYYKTHMSIGEANMEKERIEKEFLTTDI